MEEHTVEIANVEQAAAWDGHEGEHWAEHADRYDRSSWRHRAHLVDPARLPAGTRVLDIGCGCGAATREAAHLTGDGLVVGLDLSGPMLAVARERAAAEGLTNVEFVQGDAQVHPFEAGTTDLVISSFGAMFFGDRAAAFSNIGRVLRPGGRLAVLTWRELDRNEWLSEIRGALALGRELGTPPPDAPTPFSLADPDRVRPLLESAGFDAIDFTPVDEPVELGTDAEDAFTFFRNVGIVEGLLDGIDDAGRAEGLANLQAVMAAHATPDGVLLGSSAWLITAERR